MAEQTTTIDRGRRVDPRVDREPVNKTDSTRTISRRRLLGATVAGAATAVTGATIDAAVQSGFAGKLTRKALEAARELLRPKPTEVYDGGIRVQLQYAKLYGQPRITNPNRGDVNPRSILKFNGQEYHSQERFMTVKNGRIVNGFLEIKVDDGNPLGQYYVYQSLEDQIALTEKLDPTKFMKISAADGGKITLADGRSLNNQDLNETSFR